jgi:hypothetical protein
MGCYWSARRESIGECAIRLGTFLIRLSECDQSIGTWYESSKLSKNRPNNPINSKAAKELTRLLEKARNRENIYGEADEDLGFQVELWNGENGQKDARLSVRCGLYWRPTSSSVAVGNCVVLDLPRELGQLALTDNMVKVLMAAAVLWIPDWAGVMSDRAMLSRGFDAQVPFIDWMVYLPRKVERVPPPALIRNVEELGSIIIARPSPVLEATPEQLATIRLLQNSLVS